MKKILFVDEMIWRFAMNPEEVFQKISFQLLLLIHKKCNPIISYPDFHTRIYRKINPLTQVFADELLKTNQEYLLVIYRSLLQNYEKIVNKDLLSAPQVNNDQIIPRKDLDNFRIANNARVDLFITEDEKLSDAIKELKLKGIIQMDAVNTVEAINLI